MLNIVSDNKNILYTIWYLITSQKYFFQKLTKLVTAIIQLDFKQYQKIINKEHSIYILYSLEGIYLNKI